MTKALLLVVLGTRLARGVRLLMIFAGPIWRELLTEATLAGRALTLTETTLAWGTTFAIAEAALSWRAVTEAAATAAAEAAFTRSTVAEPALAWSTVAESALAWSTSETTAIAAAEAASIAAAIAATEAAAVAVLGGWVVALQQRPA